MNMVSDHRREGTRPGLHARSGRTLARGLGWFSIGLGLLEVAAPRTLARTFGMKGSERLLVGYGLREVAAGIGILASNDPTPFVWARVAGDALDLGTMGSGLASKNARKGNLALATAAVAGVTALDVVCLWMLSQKPERSIRRDYSNRTGLPKGVQAARGAARDFKAPKDMRIPEAMRPYPIG